MAKFVPDVKTQRWIVISTNRSHRPNDVLAVSSSVKTGLDPFAQGNEHLTPPEVFRTGTGQANEPGWRVRVVPNKFPITDIHEVIIHSPDAVKDIQDFDLDQINDLFFAYRQRYQTHRDDGHVLIFNNHGELAGASLSHPHSQVVVIPRQINLDVLVREPVNNVVEDNKLFTVYCPDFSQWPYEVWIAPKVENTYFGDTSDEMLKELSIVAKSTICRLRGCYDNPETKKVRAELPFAYNYYIFHRHYAYLLF